MRLAVNGGTTCPIAAGLRLPDLLTGLGTVPTPVARLRNPTATVRSQVFPSRLGDQWEPCLLSGVGASAAHSLAAAIMRLVPTIHEAGAGWLALPGTSPSAGVLCIRRLIPRVYYCYSMLTTEAAVT